MQKEKEAITTKNKEGSNNNNMKEIEIMEGVHGGGGKEETLPPGFRFHPTDEELITCYLVNKISDSNFTGRAITDVDLNKCEPWELPGKAKMGEKEWYFFSLRDRKYPTGVRTNRATNTGYWKTTGKDKEILNSVTSELVGMKKTLVFYKGRAPRGEKSNWVMHEYRIHSKSAFRTSKQDEWVVCRVFQKSAGVKKYPSSNHASRAMNPFNLEIGHHNIVTPPPMMQLGDPATAHFLYGGRNYMNTAELAEVARVLRGGTGSTSTINLPPMQPQMNYPVTASGAGFTISGLNLNLGGGGAGTASVTTQPVLRPMQATPPSQTMGMVSHHHQVHHDVSSNMISTNSIGAENVGYVTEISNTNNGGHGNRYLGMDHCMDLDSYWPSY